MKVAMFSYWMSINSMITNVNVFSSLLSVERMVTLTSTSDCLVDSNDEDVYLAWDDMKLNIFGNITERFTPVEEICINADNLKRVRFPDIFQHEECMQTCQKLSKETKAPMLQSVEDLAKWNEFFRKHDPTAPPSSWLSNVWDGENWIDWYSGQENNNLYGGTTGMKIIF